ncbi:MAG: hypothetical protein ACKOXG_03410 [Arenimonas sp.]
MNRFLLIVLFWSATAGASDAPAPASALDGPDDTRFIVQSRSFLASHPDLRARILGMKSYAKGEHREALRQFRKGAYYADKPSQAMVAEMLWKGEGAATDRAEAYVWMDMAAERLYRDLVAKREQYWAALNAQERARALAIGPGLYARYGDAAAKPRIEHVLQRDRRNITGSRTGFVGTLRIEVPGPGGMPITINGEDFYQDRFWQPEDYWKWQNVTWKALPTGTVNASELQALPPKSPETDKP